MTKAFVVDVELSPISARFPLGAVRMMECDTLGWADGKTVRMAVYGNTAVPAIGKAREDTKIDRIERWLVFEDQSLGCWIAWVKRPQDDDRVRYEIRQQRMDLLLVCGLIFFAAVLAAITLVLLPQCSGGQIGRL